MDQIRHNHMNDYVYNNDLENVKRLYYQRGYFTISALKIANDNGFYEIAKFIVDNLTVYDKDFLIEDVKNFNQ